MTIIESAMKTVCMAFEITPSVLCERSKIARLVEARMWFAWLVDRSSTEIGRMINRNHATVLYYRSAIREMIKLYPIYKEKSLVLKRLQEDLLSEKSKMKSLNRIARQRREVKDLTAALYAAIDRLSTMTNGDVTEIVVLYKDDVNSIYGAFQSILTMARSRLTGNNTLMSKNHTLDEISVKAHEAMDLLNLMLDENKLKSITKK